MLLSRLLYVITGIVVAAMTAILFTATGFYNQAQDDAVAQALNADSQVVSWYLRSDARQRAAQLIKFAIDEDLAGGLSESSKSDGSVPDDARKKVSKALREVNQKIDERFNFDAIFAVDQHGRVVSFIGYEAGESTKNFELGGYPVVADALHGYIRDDTLVLDRLYRVVARPVQLEAGQAPAGAIIGARIIDGKFAKDLANRTGAAVAFYEDDNKVASGAPTEFPSILLDHILGDLEKVAKNDAYLKNDRSDVRRLDRGLVVQYTRLRGEAYSLNCGYAVGRVAHTVSSPFDLYFRADAKAKGGIGLFLAIALGLLVPILGLVFTFLEHSRPLVAFNGATARLGKGEVDQLQPSQFSGAFRRIASQINDGIDYQLAKGGGPRKGPADLQKVLGDLPAKPQMSAFSFPGASGDDASASASSSGSGGPTSAGVPVSADDPVSGGAAATDRGAGMSDAGGDDQTAPQRPGLPKPPPKGGLPKPPPKGAAPKPPTPGEAPKPPSPGGAPKPPAPAVAQPKSEQEARLDQWKKVFDDFVATKQQCGENLDGFTFEKFQVTLQKNWDALVKRHGAKRVKFSVYVKDGKAALKASPIK